MAKGLQSLKRPTENKPKRVVDTYTQVEKLAKLTIEVPKETRQKFKLYALEHDKTMTELITEYIDSLLEAKK